VRAAVLGSPITHSLSPALHRAGYRAVVMTKTGTVGTFGGINIPPVTDFMDGFARGIANVLANVTNTAENVWNGAKKVGSWISNAASTVGNAVSKAASTVGNAVSNAASAVGNAAKKVWNSIFG